MTIYVWNTAVIKLHLEVKCAATILVCVFKRNANYTLDYGDYFVGVSLSEYVYQAVIILRYFISYHTELNIFNNCESENE